MLFSYPLLIDGSTILDVGETIRNHFPHDAFHRISNTMQPQLLLNSSKSKFHLSLVHIKVFRHPQSVVAVDLKTGSVTLRNSRSDNFKSLHRSQWINDAESL